MSTETQRTCPTCGNELSGAVEFCPVCMLRKGLAGMVASGESSVFEDTIKPIAGQAAQRFEHYELVNGEDGKPVELGRGAMGVTYKAVDVDLRCPVTLKIISERYLGEESARLRFLREALGSRCVAFSREQEVDRPSFLHRSITVVYWSGQMSFGDILQELPRLCQESVTAHLNRADVQAVRTKCRCVALHRRHTRRGT